MSSPSSESESTLSRNMWMCSMAIFVLALVLHGAHPWQTLPGQRRASWLRRKHSSKWMNRAFHEEVEAKEQTRISPVRQRPTQNLLGVCDCFVNHSPQPTGCSFEIGVCSDYMNRRSRNNITILKYTDHAHVTDAATPTQEYGPLIINGTCFNGMQRKRRRHSEAITVS